MHIIMYQCTCSCSTTDAPLKTDTNACDRQLHEDNTTEAPVNLQETAYLSHHNRLLRH